MSEGRVVMAWPKLRVNAICFFWYWGQIHADAVDSLQLTHSALNYHAPAVSRFARRHLCYIPGCQNALLRHLGGNAFAYAPDITGCSAPQDVSLGGNGGL